MRLEGIHHITAITGDAPANVEFYVGVLGLRLVKKSVNQDDPTVYHLFYADPEARPGSDLTFFEYPGIPRGRAGNGMVHRILWRLGSAESLDFWENRLPESTRTDARLLFADPEGLEHELLVADVPDEPLPSTGAAGPRMRVLEERQVAAGAGLFVGVEEVVHGWVVLVHRLLHEPQPQHPHAELDVGGSVARNGRDVVDPFEAHDQ